jgi:hypothetical protein
MKTLPIAICMVLSCVAFSFAQTGDQQQAKVRHVGQATAPRPSPAELHRCALSHKILNAASRSACGGSRSKR